MSYYIRFLILVFLQLNFIFAFGQNSRVITKSLEGFEKLFENELITHFDTNQCSCAYNCYGDSLMQLNSAVLFPENIISIFDSLLSCSYINKIYQFDSNNNIVLRRNTYFYRLIKKLSKEEKSYKIYFKHLKQFKDIPPSNVALINRLMSSKTVFSKEEKIFLLLHFAAVYKIIQ